MPCVTALTNVLTQSLGWHRARMTFMARFVLCSLQLTTTNLRRIAVSLKAGVEERSNYRRIRRFLAHYKVDYGALSRLLVRLVPQDPPYQKPPYVLVLDRTAWQEQRNDAEATVDWQFTTDDARIKLRRLYPQIDD